MICHSLRSKRFRRVWEQRKTEERGFRYFACAENGARAKKRTVACNSLLPNCTETLATQARFAIDEQINYLPFFFEFAFRAKCFSFQILPYDILK